MDDRRLSTGDVLAMGILNRGVPETEIPKGRERFSASFEYEYEGRAAVLGALEAGQVVESSNYYGIPLIWKQAEGVYRGTLLQYRNVTEAPTFATAEEAVDWFERTAAQTAG